MTDHPQGSQQTSNEYLNQNGQNSSSLGVPVPLPLPPNQNLNQQILAIYREVNQLIKSIRLNQRWSVAWPYNRNGVEEFEGDGRLRELYDLRNQILKCQGGSLDMDALRFLGPFLDVIQDEESDSSLTSQALVGIQRLIRNGAVFGEPENADLKAPACMHAIMTGLQRCRFTPLDEASEQSTVCRLLETYEVCIQVPNSHKFICDRDLLRIFNNLLSFAQPSPPRSSSPTNPSPPNILPEFSKQILLRFVSYVFSRLPFTQNLITDLNDDSTHSSRAISQIMDGINSRFQIQNQNNSNSSNQIQKINMLEGSRTSRTSELSSDLTEDILTQFGVTSLINIIDIIINMINSKQFNIVNLGLEIVLEILQSSNKNLELYPEILSLFQNGVLRVIIELAQKQVLNCVENPVGILMHCNNIIFCIFQILGSLVLIQVEEYVRSILFKILQNYKKFGLVAEVAMEGLSAICSQFENLNLIFIYCDSKIDQSDFFEDIIGTLAKCTIHDNEQNVKLSSIEYSAVGTLIGILDYFFQYSGIEKPENIHEVGSEHNQYINFWEQLKNGENLNLNSENSQFDLKWHVRRERYYKHKFQIIVQLFNQDFKKGINYLETYQFIDNSNDRNKARDLAIFLRKNPGISKSQIGILLGERDSFLIMVLQEFADSFEFGGLDVHIALRLFLESFRLPGEGQKIDRIVEAFSKSYKRQHPFGPCKSEDAIHVLSYAQIMLNSNIWNPNVREKDKMTFQSFKRQLEQQNDGENFPEEWLQIIFDSIVFQEFKLNSENPDAELSEAYWANLSIQSRQSRMRPMEENIPLDSFTCDMFMSSWAPIIQSICSIVDINMSNMSDLTSPSGSLPPIPASDLGVTEWCLRGLGTMGRLAIQYGMVEVVDTLIIILSSYLQILHIRPAQKAMVAFSRNFIAKEAFKLLFKEIIHKCGNNIDYGWKFIVDNMITLVKLELWSGNVLRVVGFIEGAQSDPPRRFSRNLTLSMKRAASSHCSSATLASMSSMFLKGLFNDEDGCLDDETEREAMQTCKKLVEECRIGDILSESKFLSDHSLVQFANAVVSHARNASSNSNGSSTISTQNVESQCICMDILLNLTIRNLDRCMTIWPYINAYVTDLIKTPRDDDIAVILIEKGITSLFIIFQRILPQISKQPEQTEKLFQAFQSLQSLKYQLPISNLILQMNQQIQNLIMTVGEYIVTQWQWQQICSLIRIHFEHCTESKNNVLQTLSVIVQSSENSEGYLNSCSFVPCAVLCKDLAVLSEDKEEGGKDVQQSLHGVLEALHSWLMKQSLEDVPNLMELWNLFALQLADMARQSRAHLLRTNAIVGLQDLLVHTGKIKLPGHILFPVFEDGLLETMVAISNEVIQTNETDGGLIGALTLLVRVVSVTFSAHIDTLKLNMEDLKKLWINILGRYNWCTSIQNERLNNIVVVELKRLLVMMVVQKEILVEGDQMWKTTEKLVVDISSDLTLDQTAGVIDKNDF